MTDQLEKQLRDLLRSKYLADPEGFRSYLPEVAEVLQARYSPRPSLRSPFGLTERERAHHEKEMRHIFERLDDGGDSSEDAIRGLDHCAMLIQDDGLPLEVGYDRLVALLKAAIGKSPGTFKSNQTIPRAGESRARSRESRLLSQRSRPGPRPRHAGRFGHGDSQEREGTQQAAQIRGSRE